MYIMLGMTMTLTKPTSSSVKAALRLKFAAPEYAILEEVRNATGRLKKRHGKQPRYADMIAMSLWPSLGLELTGFEIKVSRADWLVEISDAKKAVAVQQFCDRWVLVTPNEKIVKPGELPPSWGWMVVTGTTVKTMVEPPKLDAAPITREFLASLLRNAATSNPDYIEVQSRIIEARMADMPQPRSRTGFKAERKQTMTTQAAEIKRLKRVIADMQASGISLPAIPEAVAVEAAKPIKAKTLKMPKDSENGAPAIDIFVPKRGLALKKLMMQG